MISRQDQRILNRNTIKYLAITAMTMNHYAQTFLRSGTVVRELLVGIGYFTAITMCFFLAEGVRCTRSRRNYGLRLLVFAILSQVPFSLVWTKGESWLAPRMNVLFTLFICFLLIIAQEEIEDEKMRLGVTIGLIYASMWADWPVMAPVFTLLFYKAGEDRRAQARAFTACLGIFWGLEAASLIVDKISPGAALPVILLHSTGPVASAFVILVLYNGRLDRKGSMWEKWFFYLYYPLHLLIIGLIKRYGLFFYR